MLNPQDRVSSELASIERAVNTLLNGRDPSTLTMDEKRQIIAVVTPAMKRIIESMRLMCEQIRRMLQDAMPAIAAAVAEITRANAPKSERELRKERNRRRYERRYNRIWRKRNEARVMRELLGAEYRSTA